MASWRKVLAQQVVNVEEHFDLLKYRLRERLGGRNPIMILPYRGFGTQEKLYLRGRVLEDRGVTPAAENDSVWENLLNMYRRFESDEIPYAQVLVRFQGQEQHIRTNVEGFFEVWIEPAQPLPTGQLWHSVDLELLAPLREGYPPVQAEAQIFVPPPGCQFGVISDIDDTVLQTDATHLVKMARTVFLGNARTRLPFKGVAAFYRALLHGGQRSGAAAAQETAANPLFYVSSSPWNIYDLLTDFFHLQEIPLGPVLFLRDWGIKEDELLPTGHHEYKMGAIRKILDTYTSLNFILIGDSGQEDPEIYAEAVDQYPDRILAIYIRNVSRDLKRPEAIRALAKKVAETGITLILADDTLPMAEHAAAQGWISEADLPLIQTDAEADKAPPSPIEKLLGEEEGPEPEAATVVVDSGDPQATQRAVDSGAIEEALETGKDEDDEKKPPTVVVES